MLLGGVALLKWVFSYWRKGVAVEAGFEVSYVQATPRVGYNLLLPADQDAELSTPSPAPCLPACCSVFTMMIMD